MAQHPFKKSKKEALQVQIIEMYKAGNSFRVIAKALNISHETARKIWLSTDVNKIA